MRVTFKLMILLVAVIATACNKEPQTPPSNGFENGHEWVDLGLSSGLLWATCNMGASIPEASGDYYAWGETEPQYDNAYVWNSYKYYDGSSVTKYYVADGLALLTSSDDAAAVNWGGTWRMPTELDLAELKYKCTRTRTTQNGVEGVLFVSENGNSLFLPAVGYRYEGDLLFPGSNGRYWTSSRESGDYNEAKCFYFGPQDSGGTGTSERCRGFSIRPVCTSQK